MDLKHHTNIGDDLMRQNILRNITVHHINIPDTLVVKINANDARLDTNDYNEIAKKINVILEEYVQIL